MLKFHRTSRLTLLALTVDLPLTGEPARKFPFPRRISALIVHWKQEQKSCLSNSVRPCLPNCRVTTEDRGSKETMQFSAKRFFQNWRKSFLSKVNTSLNVSCCFIYCLSEIFLIHALSPYEKGEQNEKDRYSWRWLRRCCNR